MSSENWTNAVTYSQRRNEGVLPPQERGMVQETEDDKMRRMVVSLAVDTRAKQKVAITNKDEKSLGAMNQAEHSFALLGRALADTEVFDSVDTVTTKKAVVDIENKFAKNEPKPRVALQADGKFKPVYDKRPGGSGSETPSALQKNEYEILGVHARVRNPNGTTDYLCIASYMDDDGMEQRDSLKVEEETFIESYVLAQHLQLQSSLDKPTGINGRIGQPDVKKLLLTLTQNSASYGMDSRNPGKVYEPAQSADATLLEKEGGEKFRVPKDKAQKLAESMKSHIEKDATRTEDVKKIDAYIEAMKTGQPSAEAVLEILAIAGRPEIQKRIEDISAEVLTIDQQLTTATGDTEKKLRERRALLQDTKKTMQKVAKNAKEGNPVFDMFRDMDDGRCSPETAKLVIEKLTSISSPLEFIQLEAQDLDDPTSLASIILKHFGESRGLTDEQMQEKVAWLSKFLSEHGSDIAMMGIFALFQMMTTLIGDAAKGASH